MYIDENVKKEMKDMMERIERLNRELEIYKEDETIINNKEKVESAYNEKKEKIIAEYNELMEETKQNFEKNLKVLKESSDKEKAELEAQLNNKLKEYKEKEKRIENLEREKSIYSNNEETVTSIQHNIDKIKEEMEHVESEEINILATLRQKENAVELKIENVKEKIISKTNIAREELQEIGIEVEEFDFNSKKEQEKAPENKTINQKQDIIENANIPKITAEMKNVQTQKSEVEIEKANGDVKIIYSAKYDKYLVENLEEGTQKFIKREELQGLNKEELAQKMGRNIEDFENVDVNILKILSMYDTENKTSKMQQYFKMMTEFGKSKKDRQQEMEENQIEIEYNLKSLFDKIPGEELDEKIEKFTYEERQEILDIANNARLKGIATVKKGIKVQILERIDKIVNKIQNIKLLKAKPQLKLPNKEDVQTYKEEKINNLKEKLQITNIGKIKDYDVKEQEESNKQDIEEKER